MKNIIKIFILTATPIVFTIVLFLSGEFIMRYVYTPLKDGLEEISNFKYMPEASQISFRNGKYIDDKRPGSFRILVLGDSFSWGVCVKNATDIWPSRLQEILISEAKRDIEVVNMGLPTFTTVNEWELLNKEGWYLNPDLIVLQFTLNDPLPSGKNYVCVNNLEKVLGIKDLIPFKKLNFYLKQNSYFYMYVNGKYQDLQRAIFHPTYYKELYKEDYQGWINCKAAFATIAKEAYDKNVKVVFVIFPVFERGVHTREKYAYSDIHDKVASIAKRCGFYVIDLLDTFVREGKDFSYWHAHKFDHHPNEKAHDLTAQEVAACIIENRLIK